MPSILYGALRQDGAGCKNAPFCYIDIGQDNHSGAKPHIARYVYSSLGNSLVFYGKRKIARNMVSRNERTAMSDGHIVADEHPMSRICAVPALI